MAELEDSGSGRASGRGRVVGYQRYQLPAEGPELTQSGLFPLLSGPVEVGADGLPTGVELEQPADEEAAADADGISAPFRPENIKIETQATTVDLLLSRLREGMIDLAPDFQRRAGIWTDVQQSRLIESLLLRIPISSFHMAQDEEDNWSVVDGIQRMTAIARFMAPEAVGMPPLVLRGLDYLHDFHGMGYRDLTGRLRIRLRETQLVVHIIQQGTPEAVKFNVFSRINTGGLPLTPQEIRHAMIEGPIRGYLADLAEDPAFGDATGHSVSNERMADREMVLRFLAFRLSDPSRHAQRDFDQFLVDSMHRVNRLSEERREALAVEFRKAMHCATGIFGDHAFRKWRGGKGKSPINKALFETVAVNLATLDDHSRETLVTSRDRVLEGFFELMKDWDFDRAISVATGDTKKVRKRFAAVAELFRGVVEQ
ncbi:hypothetical protein BLA24_30960 [Streptomyces cinnamoneus]|uniref:GmrSD restriction endonucleases N-terminal domain-containing protein n=1 Tax=Streptomyces cinnamoneus TaxID=53446 RepID=A0A2G1X9M1_STRCJ|nr:DUF262 domain-containing protein [Streptomyces cinnamoneus]PHQ47922.1 hypothetical protein BLA24_30960 [Streptomyces cinnamoneus]PPT15547.1 DUF262 domain-containing protein [Streptomyces cinnamoneus]